MERALPLVAGDSLLTLAQESRMRTLCLAALVAGAVLTGCSKPEPAAGAPSPDAVTLDSTGTSADSTTAAAVPDSAAKPTDSTVTPDSTMTPDSAKGPTADSASAAVPDSTTKP